MKVQYSKQLFIESAKSRGLHANVSYTDSQVTSICLFHEYKICVGFVYDAGDRVTVFFSYVKFKWLKFLRRSRLVWQTFQLQSNSVPLIFTRNMKQLVFSRLHKCSSRINEVESCKWNHISRYLKYIMPFTRIGCFLEEKLISLTGPLQ